MSLISRVFTKIIFLVIKICLMALFCHFVRTWSNVCFEVWFFTGFFQWEYLYWYLKNCVFYVLAPFSPSYVPYSWLSAVTVSRANNCFLFSSQEYKDSVNKLYTLVKPGSFLVMHGALEGTFYNVGKYNFYSFPLSKKMVSESLEDAGFTDIVYDALIYKEKNTLCDLSGEFFIYGKKEMNL